MKNLTVLIVALFCVLSFYGQETNHPLVVSLNACLERDDGQSNMGMINCMMTSRDAWDVELNKNYKALRTVLNEEEKGQLKKAQLAWIAYRDSELAFSGSYHYNMEGTLWKVVAAGRVQDITRSRALELNEYYETRTEGD